MANRGKLIPGSGNRLPLGLWDFYDDFIEDGSLVSIVKTYRMENAKTELIFNFRESLTPDDQGNIKWNFVWRYRDVKITKIMRAQRVHNWKREMFVLNVLMAVYTLYCIVFWRLQRMAIRVPDLRAPANNTNNNIIIGRNLSPTESRD